MRRVVSSFVREPTVWFFLVAGAGLALWQAAAPQPTALVIRTEDVAALERSFTEQWGRPPREGERQALIEDFIREELLWREGRRLGLDRGDPIVRRRVVQKMTFILEAAASGRPPAEEDLRAFFETHADRYRSPERVSFLHVFWPRPTPAADHDSVSNGSLNGQLQNLLRRLQSGEAPEQVSAPFLRGLRWRERPVDEVERTFGPEFLAALRSLAPGTWSTPVSSLLGWHLVRVDQWIPPALPPFEAVRHRVEQDWIEHQRARAREEGLRKLRQQYAVRIETGR
ncbi:MAG: peptidylprolyl isomerase [Candidatus Binatia bacterium]|nr:peptidylprolyl isomerase [Candidatus Binatia bacterium]